MGVRVGLACLLAVVLAAGCGSGGGDDDSGGDGGGGNGSKGDLESQLDAALAEDDVNPPLSARVAITKDGYVPKKVNIRVGGSVTFVNLDPKGAHTAETVDLPEGASDTNEFDTHTLAWEEPYTVYFHKPEEIEYHSSFDPDMRGTINAVAKQPVPQE